MNHERSHKPDTLFIVLLGLWVFCVCGAFCFSLDNPFRDTKFAVNAFFTLGLAGLIWRRPHTSLPVSVLGCLAAYLGYKALSLTWGIHLGRGLTLLAEQVSLLVVLWAASTLKDPAKDFEKIEKFLWASGALVMMVSLLQEMGWAFTDILGKHGFFTSTFGHKNHTGQFYMLFGVFAVHRALFAPKPTVAKWGVAFVILCGWQLLLLNSRAALLGFVLGSLGLGAAALYKRPAFVWKKHLKVFLATLVFVGGFSALHPHIYQQSFLLGNPSTQISKTKTAKKKKKKKKSNADIRWQRWQNTGALIGEHPLLGVGAGQYKVHYPRFAHKDPEHNSQMMVHEAHNAFLQEFAEGGVAGGLLFILLWLLIFKHLYAQGQNPRHQSLALLAGFSLLAVFCQSLFSFPLHNPMPGVWLFLLLGLAFSQQQEKARVMVAPLRLLLSLVLLGSVVWQGAALVSSYETHQGISAIKAKKWSQANQHFQVAVAFPNADTALVKYVYSLGKEKKHAQAIKAGAQLLARHPWHHIAHDQIARQYQSIGEFQKARGHYEQAVKIYPKFKRAKKELKRLKGLP